MAVPNSQRRASLGAFTALTILLVPQAGDTAPVGFVDKVENEAKVASGDTELAAIIGTPVHMKDVLRRVLREGCKSPSVTTRC